MRILYIAELWQGGTALQRARGLQDSGHSLCLVDSTQPVRGLTGLTRRAVRRVSGHAWDMVGANRAVIDMARTTDFELIWIDKGLAVKPQTLRELRERCPRSTIISYSPDDMLGSHNQSPRYLTAIPMYDLHVTTKTYNVDELKELGAREVLFVDNAYDPHTHRPIPLVAAERKKFGGDVGFVGMYESDRAELIAGLAARGIPVDVWGPGWKRSSNRHPLVRVRGLAAWGDEYATVLNATRVNLCFLRKVNRDLQTTRSVEIPACGGFMLGERTPEHLRLFTEGREAEYFADLDELEEKCRWYLANESARSDIARRGRARCLAGGYSNRERLDKVVEHAVAKS